RVPTSVGHCVSEPRAVATGLQQPVIFSCKLNVTGRYRGCVKTPALSANGAKSNSLGQGPRSAVHGVLRALKARNNNRWAESDNKYTGFNIYCAPSALRNLKLSPPGPLAQAFTFRAFGAGNQSFHTVLG